MLFVLGSSSGMAKILDESINFLNNKKVSSENDDEILTRSLAADQLEINHDPNYIR